MSDFEKELQPEALRKKLRNYQFSLGKNFSLHDLMCLKEIKAKAMLAEEIRIYPKFPATSVNRTEVQNETGNC